MIPRANQPNPSCYGPKLVVKYCGVVPVHTNIAWLTDCLQLFSSIAAAKARFCSVELAQDREPVSHAQAGAAAAMWTGGEVEGEN